MKVVQAAPLKVLDFDIENRPLSYWWDRPTCEITSIASCWIGHPRSTQVYLLGVDDPYEGLIAFVARYNEADMVTGHYITRHDLPIINGALIEMNLPILGPKLAQDTKTQLVKRGDIPATQEHLSDMMSLAEQKLHMKQSDWREANRLTPEGIAKTRRRVTKDVRQHIELRAALIARGLLNEPKVWRP